MIHSLQQRSFKHQSDLSRAFLFLFSLEFYFLKLIIPMQTLSKGSHDLIKKYEHYPILSERQFPNPKMIFKTINTTRRKNYTRILIPPASQLHARICNSLAIPLVGSWETRQWRLPSSTSKDFPRREEFVTRAWGMGILHRVEKIEVMKKYRKEIPKVLCHLGVPRRPSQVAF